jgi:hypothetical protein
MTEQLTDHAGEQAAPGPAGPVRVAWAPVPRVDLLPLRIVEARRFRRTQAMLSVALAGTLLAAVAGTLSAAQGVSSANDELSSAQTTVGNLQAQQATYAEVPKVLAQVDAATTARTTALGKDILWYRFLNDLDGVRPSGVDLPNITVALAGSTAVTSADPLAPAGIGSFSASGTSSRYAQVSALMDGIEKVNGLRSSSLTSATRDDDQIRLTVAAVLSSDALSARYEKKAD